MKFQNCLRPITFVKETEFWCAECDGNKVHSDKPETGRFFNQFGHTWIPPQHTRNGRVGDEYVQIIFALCADCLTKGGFVEPDADDFPCTRNATAEVGLSVGKN